MASVARPLSPGIFAGDAQTTIPNNPVPGVSYRDPEEGTASIAQGWPFQRLVNSAEFNEVMYRITSLLEVVSRDSVLAWSDKVDYHAAGPAQAPSTVAATDGHLYVALQSSGPNMGGAFDPAKGVSPAYWSQFSGLAAGADIGDVKLVASENPPYGWLKCNGDTVSRIDYSGLFAVIGTRFGAGNGSTTFQLPDLRGEFVRGWDDGRGVDVGRKLGSFQESQNAVHTHTATATDAGAHTHGLSVVVNKAGAHTHTVTGTAASAGRHYHYSAASGWVKNGGNNYGGAGVGTGNPETNTAGEHTHTVSGTAAAAGEHLHTASATAATAGSHAHTITVAQAGGREARPRSVALLYVIKF